MRTCGPGRRRVAMMGTCPPGRGGPGLPPWLAAERRPPTRDTHGPPPRFRRPSIGRREVLVGATRHTAHETRHPRASRQPAACSPQARRACTRAARPSCHARSPRRFPHLHLPPLPRRRRRRLPAGRVLSLYRSVAGSVRLAATAARGGTSHDEQARGTEAVMEALCWYTFAFVLGVRVSKGW